nr:hypothetical protein [Zeya Brook chaq-like virus 2]
MATRSKPKRTIVEGRKAKRNNRGSKVGEFGARYSPPTNPPDTTAQPWWSLVLSSIRKPGDYTFDSLVTDFLKQVGTGYTFNPTSYNTDRGSPFRIQFRIERVAVWNLSGRIVSLSVWDVEERQDATTDTTQTDLLGGWVDCGGVQCFPAIGYQYPSSHHRRVYRPDPRYASVKILTTTGGTSDSILYHIHVHWRADGTAKFSTIKSDVEEITDSVSEVKVALDSISNKEGPSLATRTLSNVGVIAANYVIPLALGDSIPGTSANIAAVSASLTTTDLPKSEQQLSGLRSPTSTSVGSYDDCH